MSSFYFTADTHFGHARIIELARRPFADTEAMDRQLIENWNRKVPADGIVYVLGDFVFKSRHSAKDYIKQLNGELHLVTGNHDRVSEYWGFKSIQDVLFLHTPTNPKGYWLSHYPHRVWQHMHHGCRHLYGHVHGEIVKAVEGSLDVGVDTFNYTPYSEEDVMRLAHEPTLETLHVECAKRVRR